MESNEEPNNLLACECQEAIHPMAIKGISLFNAQKYFEAHEYLELAWRAEKRPIRELYRGILQVATAYYHIMRGNYNGAVKMFHRCHPWLEPFPSTCMGIDVDRFKQEFGDIEQTLLKLGPSEFQRISPEQFKPVPMSREIPNP